jgi:hypothetical protein
MPTERKALAVHYTPGHAPDGVDALTDLLNDDWRIVSTTAMGGTGGATAPAQFAALVILERDERKSVAGFSTS